MGTICLKPKNSIALSPRHRKSSLSRDSAIDLDHEESCKIENSYSPIKIIGKGAFGEVLLVKNIKDDAYYAMKIIRKTLFQKKKHYEHLNTETEILTRSNHPFIIKMHK